jgi:hypothetical protein
MKLNMTLVGTSILAMYGAVGTLETSTDVLGPLLVIAIAAVVGAIGAFRIKNEVL